MTISLEINGAPACGLRAWGKRRQTVARVKTENETERLDFMREVSCRETAWIMAAMRSMRSFSREGARSERQSQPRGFFAGHNTLAPILRPLAVKAGRLRKKPIDGIERPSAAKAGIENVALIAAVNRYATQKQEQNRVFPQPAGGVNSSTTMNTKLHEGTLSRIFLIITKETVLLRRLELW
jgi:hypothetical protein